MEEDYQLPKRIPRYIKRLVGEYSRNEMATIVPVLDRSRIEVITGTDFNSWNGGQSGHDLLLLVPDEFMGLIPLDQQNDIQARIAQDLNKASSSIEDEYVHRVHFEYDDDAPSQSLSVDPIAMERLWQPNMLKVFISHRDTAKVYAHDLSKRLGRMGFSCFVAHDSIEPDEEWQKEIEKAPQSMDVMLAFITDDFFDSAWTNQEIGYAIGKRIPIVSVKLQSRDPIGFIKDRQAIRGSITDVAAIVQLVFETVKKRLAHSGIWREIVITRFCNAVSFSDAKDAAFEVYGIGDLHPNEVKRVVEAYNQNSQLNGCWNLNSGSTFVSFVNKYSATKYQLENGKLISMKEHDSSLDEEIPF